MMFTALVFIGTWWCSFWTARLLLANIHPTIILSAFFVCIFTPWQLRLRLREMRRYGTTSRTVRIQVWLLKGAYWLGLVGGVVTSIVLDFCPRNGMVAGRKAACDEAHLSNEMLPEYPSMSTVGGARPKSGSADKNRTIPISLFDSGIRDQTAESFSEDLHLNLKMKGSSSNAAEQVAPSLAQRASLVNQEMDRKLADADLSSAYAEEMIATWRDRTNHEFVRNFAVQHLERYARECVVRGTWDPDSSDAADVRAALEEAVLETGTSVGGAALLALARLSEIDPHVDRARLGARASSLVSVASVPSANRASAAQVCGLLRVRSALPALRSLASDPATPTPLRLAADHAAKAIADR